MKSNTTIHVAVIYLAITFFALLACKRNANLVGQSSELIGTWSIKTANGMDISHYKARLTMINGTNYDLFDGCNTGTGTYSPGAGNRITFGNVSLTYKYCSIYNIIPAGIYITDIKKFSVTATVLRLYNEKNNLLIYAERE